MKWIGEAYWYFTFLHTDWDKKQIERINKRIQIYTDEYTEHHNDKDNMWMLEQVFLFIDETENMY